MQDITSESFKEKVSKGIVLVDFWAEWCGPCKMLTPILEELSREMEGISFYKVDADAHSDLAVELQITSIPTIIIYKDGEIIGRNQGAKPKVLMRKFIEDVINS